MVRTSSVTVFSVILFCLTLADSVCNTGGACDSNWQPFTAPLSHGIGPDQTGPAYFDGYSWDAANANIAYFIEGQGIYQGDPASPQSQLPFLGNSGGSALTSFYFQSGGQTQLVNFLVLEGLWAGASSLGWYDPNSSAWGWIFQPNGSPPALGSVAFNPTAQFGLFFSGNSTTYNPQQSYFTDSTRNGIAQADIDYAAANNISLGPESYQHFAVFQAPAGGYYIGVNDRSNQIGDLDYNDMVFTMTGIPEPGTFALMLAALGSCLGLWLLTGERVRPNPQATGAAR